MKMMSDKISSKQFLFTVACFIQSSSLISSMFIGKVEQETWIAVILGFLFCIPIILLTSTLMNKFPKKNLIGINDEVFGPYLGKLISLFYLFFFFNLLSLTARDMGFFMYKTIMSETPTVVILIAFMLVCSFAVRSGLDVVTKYNSLFVFISIAILLLSLFSTANVMRFEHFFPMFTFDLMNYLNAGFNMVAIPFGEIICFMMLTPEIDFKGKSITKPFMIGMGIGAATLFIFIIRDTAILGNLLTFFQFPSFEAMKLVSISSALSRTEVVFAIYIIILMFSKASLLLYVTVLSFCSICKIKDYKSLVLIVSALAICYSQIVFKSSTQHIMYGEKIVPYIWIFFQLVLPLLTLIIASIKSAVKKQKEAVA